jgi:hypothetical protein
MTTITFEQILEQISELPIDQQELLIEIIKRRTADERRKVLAQDSLEALEEFRRLNLKGLTAREAIIELRNYLDQCEE